jgi:NAD(P)-dependent dehydrogenase (short-subunit alcohol dehydrogenase family)
VALAQRAAGAGRAVTELRFDGRVAVVTGAGRGLGREFALLLARRGAAVVVNDIGVSADADRYGATPGADQPSVADEVVREIVASGGSAVANTADVSDPDTAHSIVGDAIQNFGQIDIVINNAGVVITRDFIDLTPADVDRSFAVHVRGSFLVAQSAWGYMTKAGYGRILNVVSVDGNLFGNLRHTAYDAAKAGLAGLTRGMSVDGAELGIAVNGLLPGANTRGQRSVDPKLTPHGTIDMRPQLVAPAAAYLVHEQCAVSGRFYAASSGRMGRVFTAAVEGFQDQPDHFSLESIHEHWDLIDTPSTFVVPDRTQDFNEMRTRVFRDAVPDWKA